MPHSSRDDARWLLKGYFPRLGLGTEQAGVRRPRLADALGDPTPVREVIGRLFGLALAEGPAP